MSTPTQEKTSSPAAWRGRIEKCKKERRRLVLDWANNVQFRKGKPFEDSSEDDRINVNLDWSKTKAKHANLFSQVPTVNLTPNHQSFKSAVPVFAKALNAALTKAKVGVAIDEAVIDCINASGIGVVAVGYERRTEQVDVPSVDLSQFPPEVAQQLVASGQVPTQKVERTTSEQFTTRRISPSDLLWPVEFAGSDFDDAPWIGHSGVMSWSEAKNDFKLKDGDKEKVINGGKPVTETIQQDPLRQSEEEMVEYDEIFYWSYRFNAEEKYFKAIRRMVLVTGLDKPAIDEPWNGQKFDPQTGSYTGSCKFPIRVLTLTYITDDAIPPSDSAIGRPQVIELIESRSQMVMQRKRSLPIRWFNSDRVDQMTQDAIMRGTWQGMLPIQGDGSRAFGEVARAAYPRDDMEIDRVAKSDLDEAWQTGANQAGSFASGERSAREAGIVQQNFQTRIGYERGRVAAFFVGIAEVLAGLLALYSDFEFVGADQLQRMDQAWDRTRISQEFVYDIRPDSTVLLDANQRIERLMGVLNMIGKSGLVDITPIIEEIVELAGLDPAVILKAPTPPPTAPANISMRLIGSADLMNPVVLAFLMKSGQAPSPQELDEAKQLLLAAQQPPTPPAAPQGPMGPGMGNPLADPNSPLQPPPGPSSAPPVGPNGNPEDYNTMSKITKRGDYN